MVYGFGFTIALNIDVAGAGVCGTESDGRYAARYDPLIRHEAIGLSQNFRARTIYAQFHRFPVGQISRNVNTTRRLVSR